MPGRVALGVAGVISNLNVLLFAEARVGPIRGMRRYGLGLLGVASCAQVWSQKYGNASGDGATLDA